MHLSFPKALRQTNIINIRSKNKNEENLNEKVSEKGELSINIIAIACIYLATFGILLALNDVLADKPKHMSMLWGFHFLIALLLSLGTRSLWKNINFQIDNTNLTQIANITVDFVTCSALIAVQLAILKALILPYQF